MSAEITGDVPAEEEEYADAEYRRFLKEKDRYADFDEFAARKTFSGQKGHFI